MKDQYINIGFEDLKVHTIVGLLPFERKIPQPLYLSLTVKVQAEEVENELISDDIGQIPSYFELAQQSKAFIIQGKFQTLETLLFKLSHHLFTQHPVVKEISLKTIINFSCELLFSQVC